MRSLNAASIAFLVLVACSSDKVVDTATVVACDAPVANAGADQGVALGGRVTLDGTASTFCEKNADLVTYTWTMLAPAGSALDESALSDNRTLTASAPSFTPDIEGDYTFFLSVADGSTTSNEDPVVIRVTAGDNPPVADCGVDQEGAVGLASTLDGSASNDPEGATLEYMWALSDAPDCSALTSADIYNSGGPKPTIVPDCDGVFTISLVVSDGTHYSEPDICAVNVAGTNRTPTADAGDSLDLGACADNPINLDGHGSYDLDGDALTYRWSLIEAPAGSTASDANISDAASPEPAFTWDVVGAYSFQLDVYDGVTWSSPDVVTFTIAASSTNDRPFANAGADVSVEKEGECTSKSYAWTCTDCEAETFELDGSGSYDPDGDDISYTWSEPTGTVSFSSRYSALADGTIAAQPATYGSTTTLSLVVELSVSDCQYSDNDQTTVVYTCQGVSN